MGRRSRRRRRSHRRSRVERRDAEARVRRNARRRRARHDDRAGLHRLARSFPRGRLRALVRPAARRSDAARIRGSHRRLRGDDSTRHVDHARRLGPRAMGRGTASPRMDRRGDAGKSRLGATARRAHVAGERRRARGGRSHEGDERRRGRDDRARRSRRADRHLQGQRRVARLARGPRSHRKNKRTARSTPPCDTSASGASRPCTTWGRGPISRYSREHIARRDCARGSTRPYRSRRGSACATPSPRAGPATHGSGSARSRDSSMDRSARTRRRCWSRSTTRRTTAAFSSTRRTISTDGRRGPTAPDST